MKTNLEERELEKRTLEDGTMRRAHQSVFGVGILLSLAGFAFVGWTVAAGVLVGATIASINLYILSRTVHNMVSGQRASWGGIAFLKFIVLLTVTYGLIAGHWVEPLALASGFAALPLGILIAGVLGGPNTPTLPLPISTSSSTASTDHA